MQQAKVEPRAPCFLCGRVVDKNKARRHQGHYLCRRCARRVKC